MTVGGWIFFGFVALCIAGFGIYLVCEFNSVLAKNIVALVSVLLCVVLFFGMKWFFTNTAKGQRALVDQKSNFSNGIERTITVYTADGNVIAQYSGKIDIEGNDGGYVLFDFDGKRYVYYNCFVESIAEIGG